MGLAIRVTCDGISREDSYRKGERAGTRVTYGKVV